MTDAIYLTCPACEGAAATETPDGHAEMVYDNPPCARCGRAGVITEAQATPEEIEADRRRREEEARLHAKYGRD